MSNWWPTTEQFLNGMERYFVNPVVNFFEGQYHWLKDSLDSGIQAWKDGLHDWLGIHALEDAWQTWRDWRNTKLTHWWNNIWGKKHGVGHTIDNIGEAIGGFFDGLGNWANEIGPWVSNVLGNSVQAMLKWFIDNLVYIIPLVAGLIVTIWVVSKYGLGKRSHRLKLGPVESEVGEVK